jgi:glycosyltransferase involved in cell wall biosynthesis
MNFGMPVLASDTVGTVGDLVVDQRNASVVPLGDLDAIARGLSIMVDDANLRRKMGAQAARDVKYWSPASAAQSVHQALRQLCGP